ncbi:hypothetical protein [Herbidospora sp. NBRC 101105]|uniref:hypothetical protein n=1 Tax=Herbidospora sp. NBRC 101105 TaxID=3032195 RepID=UPI0024A3F66E|nr:hypothetical protein [Herbidospora sp. NBRC 101105]GLX95049.1 hypothetical protein Hesp01_29990 [Herbidospora sp. NBRC 101105]
MKLTLTGTRAEVTTVPEELMFLRLTSAGEMRFLRLVDVQITTEPYTGLTRLRADLVEGDDRG